MQGAVRTLTAPSYGIIAAGSVSSTSHSLPLHNRPRAFGFVVTSTSALSADNILRLRMGLTCS